MFSLSGCLFDSSSDIIIGKYNVCWVDSRSSRGIHLAMDNEDGGGAEIVPAYVYAVGHNNRYIIAKQHPANGEFVDKTQTLYFVIDIKTCGTFNNTGKLNGIFGPLTAKGYDSLSNALKINKLKFDMTYSEKP